MANIRLKALAAKIESTYKTSSTPVVADDAIQVEENFWNNIEVDYLEQNLREDLAVTGLGVAGLGCPDGRYCHITVTVALKGCGAAFSASLTPEVDTLFRIAGLTSTVDATPGTENVVYTPRSSGFESATVLAYSADALYTVVGCRAQLTSLVLVPGQIGRATFDIWGVLVTDPTDTAIPGTLAYDNMTTKPYNVKGAGLTLNSVDLADFSNFTFEMRTLLAAKPRGNDADGHAGYAITQYNPHFRVVVDKPAFSSINPYELRQAGTLFAWDFGTIGTVQYNKYAMSGTKGRVVGHAHQDEDNLAMYDLEVRCQNSDSVTADDSFTITFT